MFNWEGAPAHTEGIIFCYAVRGTKVILKVLILKFFVCHNIILNSLFVFQPFLGQSARIFCVSTLHHIGDVLFRAIRFANLEPQYILLFFSQVCLLGYAVSPFGVFISIAPTSSPVFNFESMRCYTVL